MESIGAFAGGIAHNFRNILQAISGNTEYLELVCGEKPDIADLTTTFTTQWKKALISSTTCCISPREAESTRGLPLTSLR